MNLIHLKEKWCWVDFIILHHAHVACAHTCKKCESGLSFLAESWKTQTRVQFKLSRGKGTLIETGSTTGTGMYQ